MKDRAAFGPAAHDRVVSMSRRLAVLLAGCSKRELEMLIRYYVHGQDERSVMAAMGCSRSEFACLRARLREQTVSQRRPKARGAAAS